MINRSSGSSHRFSYPDGVMTNPSNALDLSCHYYWETFDGNPPVVEHWTSEAEHFYFRYDLKARTFRATYLLGSEELHSKEDLGLITCRGIGGERYAI